MLALALLGGGVSLVLTLTLFFATQHLTQQLLEESLHAELEDYIARRLRNPQSLPPDARLVKGYVSAHPAQDPRLPVPLIPLTPGGYALTLDDIPCQVIVADRADLRFYMVYDATHILIRAQRFGLLLAGMGLGMVVLSVLVGGWLAWRVTLPVAALAQRVQAADLRAAWPATASTDYGSAEIAALAAAFERQLARLGSFIERERAFTADVSHELRTPLAVIQGAVEVLETVEDLPPPQAERLARIARAVRQATELTAALLALAREENGAAQEQHCAVVPVVQDALDKLRPLIRHKPVTVRWEMQATPEVAAHPMLLFIVVSNLIRNAFAFTEVGTVRVLVEARRVMVCDTGSGIGSGDAAHIFQRYYKGSTSQGAGIGLSLVKRICDRYQWEICLTSAEQGGTQAELVFTPLLET